MIRQRSISSCNSANRQAKRPRYERGEDDYMPGNIVEVELYNFMTFNHIKCKPGTRLNLCIGPNGSGKSSLVCAVSLGLGGEPQQLGRATSVGAYVKRGEQSGYIKITLRGYTEEEELKITRKIDIHNKSEWLFNSKVVPKREILEITQRFNIQVNNLTQFLPQDRVCEFAKLTPVQLLEETEKAVGDPQLPVDHRSLVTKSEELKKFELTVDRNRESLSQLKALNAEQEKDVERVRQRKELLEKAESMKKKMPWLKYDLKKTEYMEAKVQVNDAKRKLDAAAKILNELKQPIEKKKQEKIAKDAKFTKVRNLLDGNLKRRMKLSDNERSLSVKARGKISEIEELRKQEQSHQDKISRVKEELAAAEEELRSLPPYVHPKDELDSLGNQIQELVAAAREKRYLKTEKEKLIDHERSKLAHSVDRLKEMEKTYNKRLNALKNSGADRIFEAYRWVQENRHTFKKEVYGPVLIEVNVSNRVYADYLESHVPSYIWKAFVTQDPVDRDTLANNLKQFDAVVINHVGGQESHTEPFRITEEMSALGITSRLDQIFDSPYAVKEVLTGQSGLAYSYIGSKESDAKADQIQRLGIMDLWTPENHYRWNKSRYGNHVSGSVKSVSRSHLLLSNVDAGEVEKLRSRKRELEDSITVLDEDLKSIQRDLKVLEEDEAQLQRKREDIFNAVQHEKRKRREMEETVSKRKLILKSMEREEDLDSVIAKLIDAAADLNIQRFESAMELKNLLIEAIALRRSLAEKNLTVIELEVKCRDMEAGCKQQETLVLQASTRFEDCMKEAELLREHLMLAQRHAESIAKISPEVEQEFLEMPGTIEELEAEIQDTISQANSILFLNHSILEEYERRQNKIETLASKQESDEIELTTRVEEINKLKENWLPKLRSLVAQINETFSKNFQEMAVAGEVSLHEHDMDFDKYGILIKVKFRQTGQLQVLSAHHQSGGERSVSTILYLVSLQDLTNCPFRVVDEINQGMDPINERNMFQQLVRAASKINTPQCFLLTPKLLKDLVYTEACTLINMITGPFITEAAEAHNTGESWSQIMGKAEKSH